MLYLIGSIILTSYLTLSFKVVERFGINNFQAIVFNYITCVLTGTVVNGSYPLNSTNASQPWFIWSVLMGAVFIALFNLIALTAQRNGVAVASVANKLSLVIPFIFSIYLYNEESTGLKIFGVVIAILAVILTCYKSSSVENSTAKPFNLSFLLLPFILFIGSGLLDTMIKYVEDSFLNGDNNNDYLVMAFSWAGAIGIVLLLTQFMRGKQKFDPRAVLAGVAIGIPNYFSIWCLVMVLKLFPGKSSTVIPINNMGIVLFSSLVALIMFREKLSLLNWLGILTSLIAIALIAYG